MPAVMDTEKNKRNVKRNTSSSRERKHTFQGFRTCWEASRCKWEEEKTELIFNACSGGYNSLFQMAGRKSASALTSSNRDARLSRWSKVVTGFTPSIPFRSPLQRSCRVTESRDFRKYPKNPIFVETGSWSLSLCARPALSPTYSKNLFMPTQTHTGDIWSASCCLCTHQVECFPLVIWHRCFCFHPSRWYWLFFFLFPYRRSTCRDLFFSQTWRAYEKHQFCPQNWDVLIEQCEVNTAIIHWV